MIFWTPKFVTVFPSGAIDTKSPIEAVVAVSANIEPSEVQTCGIASNCRPREGTGEVEILLRLIRATSSGAVDFGTWASRITAKAANTPPRALLRLFFPEGHGRRTITGDRFCRGVHRF